MSFTEKFGQLPKKLEGPRPTPGVLKIGIKSCSGLASAEGATPNCVLYNPSGVEVMRTPPSSGPNPDFPMAESKATLMFHNEHGNIKLIVKDKESIMGGVYIPVEQLLTYEGGVLTVSIGSPADVADGTKLNKGPAVFSPFRVVKGETPAPAGYITIQYQYTAGGTCKEPDGTKPAEPFKEVGELKAPEKKKREKTPDPTNELAADKDRKKKDKTPEPVQESKSTLAFGDQSSVIATLPAVPEKPILRVDSIVSILPQLANAELYFADTFQFAADPINGRNNKVACILFVTRTHLYVVEASQSPVRCIPLQDISFLLSKADKICIKCMAQHDFYGELASPDSAKSLGSILMSLASAVGGKLTIGDLKEVKSHQWAPREGYQLAMAMVHSPPAAAKSDADKKERKAKTPVEPVTAEPPAATKAAAPQPLPTPVTQVTREPPPSIIVSSPAAAPPQVYTQPELPIRARFERYCAQYIPDRLPSLDLVLRNNRGKEEELMAQLVRTYGPEPNDEGPPAIDPSSPHLARLTRLFAKYQPARMAEAPYLLRQHKNDVESLFASLSFVYGPEPSEGDSALPATAIFGSPMSPPRGQSKSFGVEATSTFVGQGDRPTSFLRLEFPFAQPAPLGAETNYIKPPQALTSMMPSLNFAAVLWAGHVAYQHYTTDSPTPIVRVRAGILTNSHVYVGTDFHYERCIPIAHIERFYLRAKLRSNSTHVRVLTIIKVKAPEPDCCFEFADQQEAERMISIAMRLAQIANHHHAIDTAPFESTQEGHFSLNIPDGYRPRTVEPLPLLPQYVPIMGRYRQRLMDIYQRHSVDKLEDVDRVLYMFPHEEEGMVAKLQDTFGGHPTDGDESDIIGLAQGLHTQAQRTYLQQSSVAYPSAFLEAPEDTQKPKYSFYDPSPMRSSGPTVGRYTVGGQLYTAKEAASPLRPVAVIASDAPTASIVGHITVADLLKAHGYSVLGFNRAAAEGSAYLGVTASSSNAEILYDIRYKLAQCGDDEIQFLELIRGGKPIMKATQLRSATGTTSGVWAPAMEPLEGSASNNPRGKVAIQTQRPPMTQLTQQHPLWPYL